MKRIRWERAIPSRAKGGLRERNDGAEWIERIGRDRKGRKLSILEEPFGSSGERRISDG